MRPKLIYAAVLLGLMISACNSDDCCVSEDSVRYALMVKSKKDSSDLLDPNHAQTLNNSNLKIYYLDKEDNRELVSYSIHSFENGEYFLNHMSDENYGLRARSILVWGEEEIDTIKLEMSYIFDEVKYLENVYFNGSRVWNADSVEQVMGLTIVEDRFVTIYK